MASNSFWKALNGFVVRMLVLGRHQKANIVSSLSAVSFEHKFEKKESIELSNFCSPSQ